MMTTDEAIKLLANNLQFEKPYWQDDGDECERCARALVEWFNYRQLGKRDVARLKQIALAGFRFWNCPVCGELVCEGSTAVEAIDPEWRNFQGVHENDRCSYPGNGYDDMRCNHCRCFMVGESRLPDGCEC